MYITFSQDSYEVSYKAEGQSSDITTSCTDSPCEFTVGGAPGQLYTVSVFAVQQTFHSVPAVVQHNTGSNVFLVYVDHCIPYSLYLYTMLTMQPFLFVSAVLHENEYA